MEMAVKGLVSLSVKLSTFTYLPGHKGAVLNNKTRFFFVFLVLVHL